MDKKRLLKADKNFIPPQVDEDDEYFPNGIFEFNITKLQKYIDDNPGTFKPVPVEVHDAQTYFSIINESHLLNVDISKPVILAEIAPDKYNLIDGHHRMARAYKAGIKEIMAYKLPAACHMNFITSTRSYKIYVEYWNSKLKEE